MSLNYTLESSSRKVTVNSLGAEIQSIVSRKNGEEFLWQGDPEVWSGRAPILFPFVGALKGKQISVNGKTHAMPQHGFARTSIFEIEAQATDRLKCRLTHSRTSLEMYPWKFQFDVEFSLIEDLLRIEYTLKNTDDSLMYFNLGSHPAFNLPLQDSKISDYMIRFNKPELLARYKVVEGLLSRETVPGLKNESEIWLNSEIFEDDALVYRNVSSDVVSLVHREKGERVVVTTGGAPHLGVWAKPAAPYVCIEPWFGHADFTDSSGHLAEKDSIQQLSGDEIFTAHMTIKTLDTPGA